MRRFVRLSSEKGFKSLDAQDGSSCSGSNIPIHTVPLNSVGPTSTEEPSCSMQDEVPPSIDDSGKYFVANIFSLMRKEETFSGQVKLLEWILQIQNSSALYWFLTNGGVMILATWLSQAAIEEQTSVLHFILKVLCHLPLHKALPAHMSAILQSVNKLRFYRTSDISNRAKILLSRWSKIFARSQAMRKPNAMLSPGDAQDEMLLKQSIVEIMGNESWETKVDMPDGTLIPSCENLENSRNSQPIKLLMASNDSSNKRLLRGVSSQTRERRKVQLVQQPGQRVPGRSSQVARSVPATHSRPLSADDIQKSKMRAQFMQSKYQKSVASSSEEIPLKIEGPNPCSSSAASTVLSTPKPRIQPKVEEHKKPMKPITEVLTRQEATLPKKLCFDVEEPLWKKCKRFQVSWLTPPELKINTTWSVGTGESSKEVEIQKNRVRREKGITYKTDQEIPPNPKEPWDREMDYDDTLTPEIPSEQLPDNDTNTEMEMDTGMVTETGMETEVPGHVNPDTAIAKGSTSGVSENVSNNNNMPEPDLELLAVLLKNPELVFALTSGQGGNLSGEQMVKLLDTMKANGVSSLGSLGDGLVERRAEEKVEVSLPSPTPSSDPVTSGWRPEIAKNPFSRQNVRVNGEAITSPAVSCQEKYPASRVVQMQIPINGMSASGPQLTQQAYHPCVHQRGPAGSGDVPNRAFAMGQNWKLFSAPMALHSMHDDTAATVEPPQVVANTNFSPSLLPTPAQPQVQLQMQPPVMSEHSWSAREGLASSSNSYAQPNHHTHYNAYAGGQVRAPLHPGTSWERNKYYRGEGEPGLESWSTGDSPGRSQDYMAGWSYSEPRMNMGHNYRPEMSRPGNYAGYRDHGRNGNPRYRDRRR